jgi:hypothetical protein
LLLIQDQQRRSHSDFLKEGAQKYVENHKDNFYLNQNSKIHVDLRKKALANKDYYIEDIKLSENAKTLIKEADIELTAFGHLHATNNLAREAQSELIILINLLADQKVKYADDKLSCELMKSTLKLAHIGFKHAQKENVAASWAISDYINCILDLMPTLTEVKHISKGIFSGILKGSKNVVHLITNPKETLINLTKCINQLGLALNICDSDPIGLAYMSNNEKIIELEKQAKETAQIIKELELQFKKLSFAEKIEKISELATEWILTDAVFKAAGIVGKTVASQIVSKIEKISKVVPQANKLTEISMQLSKNAESLYSTIECVDTKMTEKIGKETILKARDELFLSHWCLAEKGCTINGRYYTIHALERMAPPTKEVIEELERRALMKGYARGTDKFNDYVQPRGVPPSVVEDSIQTLKPILGKKPGTLEYKNNNVLVVTNIKGDVITVYKNSGKK